MQTQKCMNCGWTGDSDSPDQIDAHLKQHTQWAKGQLESHDSIEQAMSEAVKDLVKFVLAQCDICEKRTLCVVMWHQHGKWIDDTPEDEQHLLRPVCQPCWNSIRAGSDCYDPLLKISATGLLREYSKS